MGGEGGGCRGEEGVSNCVGATCDSYPDVSDRVRPRKILPISLVHLND